MPDPAAIAGTFADYRTVKTRKVLQLIIEVPIEQQEQAFERLGFPVPDRDLWVAVARMDLDAASKAPAPKPDRTLAQRAGILCNDVAFQRWIGVPDGDVEAAAEAMRTRLSIPSRRVLDESDTAAQAFREMEARFLQAAGRIPAQR